MLMAMILLQPVLQGDVDAAALQRLVDASRPIVEAKSYASQTRFGSLDPDGAPDDGPLILDVNFQQEQPLMVRTAALEAFRGAKRLAYRPLDGGGEWQVTALDAAVEDPAVQSIAAMPLPHHLFKDLGQRVTSLKQSEVEEDGASIVFEAELKGATPGALAVTVSAAGQVTQIQWTPLAQPGASNSIEHTWTYLVTRLNKVDVNVPDEVRALLEGEGEVK